MLVSLLLPLFFVLISSQSCPNSNDPLVRCTSEGLIRGKRVYPSINRSTPVHAYLGIPYGEPPIGEQRFRRSIKKRPWNRSIIYDTTEYSNTCYQMIIDTLNATGEKIWTPTTPMSEDCLYLNIWTPIVNRQQQPLAVMVWIYGGGFTSGSVRINLHFHYFLLLLFIFSRAH